MLGPLVGWAETCRQPPSLIIHDSSSFEIPWELLRLKGRHLGAWFRVTRLAPRPTGGSRVRLDIVPRDPVRSRDRRAGDPDRRPGQGSGAGRGLDLKGYQVSDCTDLASLGQRLAGGLGVGLVYIYCHGEFDADTRKIFLSSWSVFSFGALATKAKDRPLIFVNACNSGRLSVEEAGLYGLPEVMLAKVGDGFIGTLGPVEQSIAVAVAASFLKQVGPDGTVEPAEALRRLREDAPSRRGRRTRSTRNSSARFLNAFMYVYFGNPLDRFGLLLTAAPGGPNG